MTLARRKVAKPAAKLAGLQGYLAHKKLRLPRTLPYDFAQGPMVALGEGAVSYERGTSVSCKTVTACR